MSSQLTEQGFTMVELVMVMIILGVLSVFVMPRLDSSGFKAIQFHDQVVSALRYAQKSATSHRRTVCVVFGVTSVTLSIDHDRTGGCDGPLNLPLSNSNVLQSGSSDIVFVGSPADFNFNPDGSGTDTTLSIDGSADIKVVGATGYVQ